MNANSISHIILIGILIATSIVVTNSNVGRQGPQGPQGPQGHTGFQGPMGAIGLQGPTGPRGPQGITGQIGSQGPQGSQGATGAQGPVAINGDQGFEGAQGDQGLVGPIGPLYGYNAWLYVGGSVGQLASGPGYFDVDNISASVVGSNVLFSNPNIQIFQNGAYLCQATILFQSTFANYQDVYMRFVFTSGPDPNIPEQSATMPDVTTVAPVTTTFSTLSAVCIKSFVGGDTIKLQYRRGNLFDISTFYSASISVVRIG